MEVRAIASPQNHISKGNDQNIKGFNNLIKDMMHGPNIVNGGCQLKTVRKLYEDLRWVKSLFLNMVWYSGLNLMFENQSRVGPVLKFMEYRFKILSGI